jgi:hypothetical protein
VGKYALLQKVKHWDLKLIHALEGVRILFFLILIPEILKRRIMSALNFKGELVYNQASL